MIDQPTATLDTICQAIGYSNTRVIQAWYAGRNLYIPVIAQDDHPLGRLISQAMLRVLVGRFGGRIIFVPSPIEDYRYFLERQMAHQIANGATDEDLTRLHGLTPMRVFQLRRELEENGWIDYAKAVPGPRPNGGRNKGIEQRLQKNFETG